MRGSIIWKKLCRAFMGNMALRINFPGKPAFYIPDVMVVRSNRPNWIVP